jgi:hypothetical protein
MKREIEEFSHHSNFNVYNALFLKFPFHLCELELLTCESHLGEKYEYI